MIALTISNTTAQQCQITLICKASPLDANGNFSVGSSTHKLDSVKAWHDKPLGLIGIGVVIFILGSIAIYLIKQYIGLAL